MLWTLPIEPLGKELKSLRKTTAVLNITTEAVRSEEDVERTTEKRTSLKQYLLEKLRAWVNSLLEAERDEFLGRGRHPPLDEGHQNYRNVCRPRKINFFGLGEIELRVPRDQQGEFESEWLPESCCTPRCFAHFRPDPLPPSTYLN